MIVQSMRTFLAGASKLPESGLKISAKYEHN